MPERVAFRNLTTTSFALVYLEISNPLIEAQKRSRNCFWSPQFNSSPGVYSGSHKSTRNAEESCNADDEDIKEEQKRELGDIRLEPFTTYDATIPSAAGGGPGQLHFVIQDGEGRRYTLDTPTVSRRSYPLLCVDNPSSSQYTCIYNHESSHLTLIDTPGPKAWMSAFSDSTPLTALCIPGTHNTTTSYVALPTVRCQAVSPQTQLENGIRFFDLRLQANTSPLTNPILTLVHDAFPISLTGPKHFSAVLETIKTFLRANPSETLILSLKREGTGHATDADLARALHSHYTHSSTAVDESNPDEYSKTDFWFTEPRIPTLGEVRGKIVLLRRFALPKDMQKAGFGLDAREWEYKSANCLHGDVHVQDSCILLRPTLLEQKIKYVCEHLSRAGIVQVNSTNGPEEGLPQRRGNPRPPKGEEMLLAPQPPLGPLYLNFLSASNFWRVGCWPERLARRINPAILHFLCEQFWVERDAASINECGVMGVGDGGVGVIICDWVGENGDWDLIKFIIGMNSRLRWRIQQDERTDLIGTDEREQLQTER